MDSRRLCNHVFALKVEQKRPYTKRWAYGDETPDVILAYCSSCGLVLDESEIATALGSVDWRWWPLPKLKEKRK